MWSPTLRGGGRTKEPPNLLCWLAGEWVSERVCVSVCVCAVHVCRCEGCLYTFQTTQTEQTSRCQWPFIYLCLIIIKTGTVAKTMTILRLRHGIGIRIGIFISAFLFQIKRRKSLLCMPWFVMYLWAPWFHFWNLKESAYEYNLICLRQWTIYLYISRLQLPQWAISVYSWLCWPFETIISMYKLLLLFHFVQSLTDCAANNSTISREGGRPWNGGTTNPLWLL